MLPLALQTYLDPPNDLQRGSYDGIADVFVLRDILQHSKTRQDAEAYINAAKRTWGIWIGVGDYASQQLDLIGYRQNSSIAYTDVTMPSQTLQPFIKDVAYVDKHPQPSHMQDLPALLQSFYGNISTQTIKQIAQSHQTGDVHWATYDFAGGVLQLAIARTNSQGEFYPDGQPRSDVWCAYNRPSLVFSLDDLWQGV